ncbi:MAG: thiamine ABC transporter substrate-binding protein, partial [Bacillota bacterium]|nr:thiamine ABC transporter substrate-binding protein [Bacillota bacterium]
NHLDIPSREALEDALLNYNGTLLVISHDRYFLNKVINKIYELTEDGTNLYLGNYDYYVEKKKNPLRFEEAEEQQGKTKTQIQEEKKKKRDIEKAEKEKQLKIKNIEKDISDLESSLLELQNMLCSEEVYSNPQKSEEISKTISEKQKNLEGLYEVWEEML